MDPPLYPEQTDCCGSGCTPCIFDIYEQKLEKYNKYLQDGVLVSSDRNVKNCLSELKYTSFEIISIKSLTDDTNIYSFKHDSCDGCKICYKPGQHLLIRRNTTNSEENISRAYTVLPSKDASNCFTIMVKLYQDGKMSSYFKDLKIGTKTHWRGPYGNYVFDFKSKYVLMICQGTGIAPFYTILNNFLNNVDCETFFKLYYCCRDVYFHEEIYKFDSFWNFSYEIFQSGNIECKRYYGEKIFNRRLTNEDINNFFVVLKDMGFEDGVQILVCGSENFVQDIKKLLPKEEHNYSLHVF